MDGYHTIKTKKDIEKFKKATNCLHDGYILSMSYTNEGMMPHSDRFDFTQTALILRICVTSIDDIVAEIIFDNILEMQFKAGCHEILDSSVAFLENGYLIWADACCVDKEYYKEESYVIARSMKWKIL